MYKRVTNKVRPINTLRLLELIEFRQLIKESRLLNNSSSRRKER